MIRKEYSNPEIDVLNINNKTGNTTHYWITLFY